MSVKRSIPPLTPGQVDTLHDLAWAMHYFGSLTTNNKLPKRKMDRLIARGLACCTGPVEQCDGDGFHIEGRCMKLGHQLTAEGLATLKERTEVLEEYEASVLKLLKDQKEVP